MRIGSVAQFPDQFKSAIICRPPLPRQEALGSCLTKISGDVVPLSAEVLTIINDQVTTRRFRCRIHGVRHVRVET